MTIKLNEEGLLAARKKYKEVNNGKQLFIKGINERDAFEEAIQAYLPFHKPAECCVTDEGEPSFVLLGRDPQAPDLLRRWAEDREQIEPDSDKPEKARLIADAMGRYKTQNPNKGAIREFYTELKKSRVIQTSLSSHKPAEWLPIETAPKDGTHFIICDEEGQVFEGYYKIYCTPSCFVKSQNEDLAFATHWMPLPTPPQRVSQGGGDA